MSEFRRIISGFDDGWYTWTTFPPDVDDDPGLSRFFLELHLGRVPASACRHPDIVHVVEVSLRD